MDLIKDIPCAVHSQRMKIKLNVCKTLKYEDDILIKTVINQCQKHTWGRSQTTFTDFWPF